jgi:hypothetical protein
MEAGGGSTSDGPFATSCYSWARAGAHRGPPPWISLFRPGRAHFTDDTRERVRCCRVPMLLGSPLANIAHKRPTNIAHKRPEFFAGSPQLRHPTSDPNTRGARTHEGSYPADFAPRRDRAELTGSNHSILSPVPAGLSGSEASSTKKRTQATQVRHRAPTPEIALVGAAHRKNPGTRAVRPIRQSKTPSSFVGLRPRSSPPNRQALRS